LSNLKERIITAIVFVIVLLGSIIQSQFSVSILFLVIILLCQIEFYNFFKPTEIKPQKLVGTLGGLSYFGISVISIYLSIGLNNLFLIIPIVFSIFIVELYRKRPQPIPNVSFTILGIIYISVPFTLLHQIAFFDTKDLTFGGMYHYEMLLGYFLILWANDTGAYFIGSKFGKHPLFPSISPKKTWEGTFGGAFFGLLAASLNFSLFPELGLMIWLSISVIIIIFGSLGDLVEAMFKRSLKVKDSGKLLPGHGGVLDRFDGIFISAPMVYVFLRLIAKSSLG